jgi:hypothetical protein
VVFNIKEELKVAKILFEVGINEFKVGICVIDKKAKQYKRYIFLNLPFL